MIQARARSCFSSEFLVSHNGNSLGHFRGKWFSESIQIGLLERRKLEFQKTSFWGSRFSLVDLATGTVLATAQRQGFFRLKWQLNLSVGTVFLYRKLFASRENAVEKDGAVIGKAVSNAWCSRGWDVSISEDIPLVDQLMIGLVHHVDHQRSQNSTNSS